MLERKWDHDTASRTRLCPTRGIKRKLKGHQNRAPVATSQILSVLSSLPLSTLAPSGEKEQEITSLECPLRMRFSSPAKESVPWSQYLVGMLKTGIGSRNSE